MSMIELTDHEKEYLSSIGSTINYPKGQIIFSAGQRPSEVYFIKGGWVRIYRTTADGRQVSVALRYPGEFIGLAEILSGSERACMAEAMDSVSLLAIWGDDFKTILARKPEFSAKIMNLMGARLREAQNIIYDFISNQTQGRLALVLVNMAERSGVADGEKVNVRLKVTQEELACMIGASRQTVSSLLTLFREDGCLKYEGREIVAVNTKKLKSWIG